MGRAIVRDPAVFLMDEPLSNLDAKLRVQMRTEVSRIQQQLGTTTVYVTHDQTEAMTLGDRVAVMRAGLIQQVGSPMELYNQPVNLFVAGFVGSPAMNFMPATVDGDTVKLPFGDVRLPSELHDAVRDHHGKQLIAGIRPEHFEDASLAGDALDHGATFTANIEVLESLGAELYAHFTVASDATIESEELRELAEDAGGGEVPMAGEEGRIVARLDPASEVSVGQEAELFVDATRLQLFDPDDGRNLTVEQQGPAATTGDGGGAEAPATGDAEAGRTEGRGDAEAESGAPADTTQDVTGEDPDARREGEDRPGATAARPAARPSSPSAGPYFNSRRSLRTIVSSSIPGASRSWRIASTIASSHSWVRSTR